MGKLSQVCGSGVQSKMGCSPCMTDRLPPRCSPSGSVCLSAKYAGLCSLFLLEITISYVTHVITPRVQNPILLVSSLIPPPFLLYVESCLRRTEFHFSNLQECGGRITHKRSVALLWALSILQGGATNYMQILCDTEMHK